MFQRVLAVSNRELRPRIVFSSFLQGASGATGDLRSRRRTTSLVKLFFLTRAFVTAVAGCAAMSKPVSAADLAYINQSVGRAIASDTCANVQLWTMVAAQTYDYVTSYRNFQNGYVETDKINRPFTQVFHNTKIGLALGLVTVDLIGMRLTQHSNVLRCAFEMQRTAASIRGAIHNNAISGAYRP